jgi:hypothetical protein
MRLGSRQRRAQRPMMRQWCAPSPRSKMVGGGGMTVSRATEKRERARGQKFAKCGKRECGA